MYTQDFWDNIYRTHFDDAPWMNDSWKGPFFQMLTADVQSLLHGHLDGAKLLDYGCGNGHIGCHFAQMGMFVDLADISTVLVDKLQALIPPDSQIRVFQVSEPNQLPQNNTYDIILSLSFFHHINPDLWTQFLSQFIDKLNSGAYIIISGWDESDPIIRNDMGLARYTQHPTWCINQLSDIINKVNLTLECNKHVEFLVPQFGCNRHFRYFIANKTN